MGQTNFDGNTANNRGGALANLNNDSASTAFSNTVNIGAGSTFTNNSAKMGGAIYNTTDAVMTIGDNVSFIKNTSTEQGAAFYNMGSMTLGNNILFQDNRAEGSDNAAIIAANINGSLTIGDNVRFENNFVGAENGTAGAILNQNGTVKIGDNALFQNNTAQFAAGAIYQEVQNLDTVETASTTIGNNAKFIGNTARSAAAIYNYNANSFGKNAIMTIGDNALFQGNKTVADGGRGNAGAIGNYLGEMTIGQNSMFDNNTAAKDAGAIMNTGTLILSNNATFQNNTAAGQGGAIFNDVSGSIAFAGDVTFKNNMANGNKNDIHNNGHLIFDGGTVTLDGGITGNGSVEFIDGTNLKTALLADAASNAIITADTITGNINLVIENGSNGGQVKFDATNNNLNVANSNALYNIEGDDTGLYSVTKKSSAEVAAATGVAAHHADTLVALTNGTSQNESFNAVSDAISTLVQSSDASDVAAGVKAVAALAPSTTPVAVTHTTQNVNQIFSAVSSRLSSGSISFGQGESSGDEILGNGAVWAKALYNKTKLNTESGYDAHSRGLAVGAEGHIHDQVKIGVGYAYTNSDIKPDSKKAEVDSNSAILYAEYKPNNWFLNGIASYTWGRYDDHRYVLGTDVSAKYDVNSFSAQVQTGYDFHVRNYTLTPEIGLRYVNVDQKGFTDTLGNYTDGNKSDVLTGVIGATGKAAYVVSRDVTLKPELRLAATYDFVNDDSASVMTLANGSVVTAQGKTLKKLSGEVGFGLTAEVMDKVELGVGYEGKFRKHYQDHTGMITAKYNF